MFHLTCQATVIILDRNELGSHFAVVIEFEQCVPNVRSPIVFRASQDADVDEMPSARQLAVPSQSGMGCENHIGLIILR